LTTKWILITGAYPPSPGGVSDYTWLVANELAHHGEVHVWTGPAPGPELQSPVIVHRLPDFSPLSIRRMHAEIMRVQGPKQIVVQYVAQAFGYRGLNVFFALWLAGLRPLRPWVMFHEVEVSFAERQSLKERIQAHVTSWMARRIVRAADKSFVSTSNWIGKLQRHAPIAKIIHTPIPSNIPTYVETAHATNIRARYCAEGVRLLGHFGTYRMREVNHYLERVLPPLLRAGGNRQLLLLGRHGDSFGAQLREAHPDIAASIHPIGALSPSDLAAHIDACDVLLQPYPEGVTTRRGSLLAALGLGSAIVTTLGPESEPLWIGSEDLALASPDTQSFIDAAERLIRDERLCSSLRSRATAMYSQTFSLRLTIDAMLRELS
jgi:glycosyltransferase involved in cell wall biosynthesis